MSVLFPVCLMVMSGIAMGLYAMYQLHKHAAPALWYPLAPFAVLQAMGMVGWANVMVPAAVAHDGPTAFAAFCALAFLYLNIINGLRQVSGGTANDEGP